MAKKKVILYLKNGSQENLYPKDDSQYERLIENLESGELIHIDKGSGTTKTIRSNNIEWWETEILKEETKTVYKTKDGKVLKNQEGIRKLLQAQKDYINKKKGGLPG